MAHKHLGQDFIPHDVVAKVTGEAKYAEDFRVDGMVFARLLGSSHPHARVKSISRLVLCSGETAQQVVLGMLAAFLGHGCEVGHELEAGRSSSGGRIRVGSWS